LRRTHIYIVGAGFSKYAGLPLQAQFTEALLEPRNEENYDLKPLIDHLGDFVHDAFDHKKMAKAKYWPELEDVFTNIDLAANSGHHLGSTHAPSNLRSVRRALLARMMCMLHERFSIAEQAKGDEWMKLDGFLQGLEIKSSAFISMNWDTVIERRLASLKKITRFDYRCGAIAASFPRVGDIIARRESPEDVTKFPIVKMHGSVNWLYCDNCRQLYWFPTKNALSVAMQLITQNEAKDLKLAHVSDCERWRCLTCTSVPLTTRIATFSFLKALDFPMFEKSWISAERLLREADKWIFIGYSLPAADYEFKHLLKRVQLSRSVAPEFIVISGGPKKVTEYVYSNYHKFFGLGIRRSDHFFAKGLTPSAIRAAHD
jgi:hypothetical protein